MAQPKQFPPGAKCVVCREPLGLRALTANNQYYHRECLKCATCDQLLDMRFFTNEGKHYCRTCYLDKFADKCAGK